MSDPQRSENVELHSPTVVGGPTVYGWECPTCGTWSSDTWPSAFEAAYAAGVHVRNPSGPTSQTGRAVGDV